MSRILPDEFILKTTDADGGEKPEDQGGAGETDINKLRSAYDAQVAELQKQLREVSDKASASEAKLSQNTVYGSAYVELTKEIHEIDLEDEKAAARLKEVALKIADAGAQARSIVADVNVRYKETLAEKGALEIVQEAGGSTGTYKAELMKARNDTEMRQLILEIKERVSKEMKAKQGQPEQRRVDNGQGRASSSDLLKELQDIDVTTPDGAKKFAEKEKEYKRRIEQAAGAR